MLTSIDYAHFNAGIICSPLPAPVSCTLCKFTTVYCYAVYFCLLYNKQLQVDQTQRTDNIQIMVITYIKEFTLKLASCACPWCAHSPCLCPATSVVIMWQQRSCTYICTCVQWACMLKHFHFDSAYIPWQRVWYYSGENRDRYTGIILTYMELDMVQWCVSL